MLLYFEELTKLFPNNPLWCAVKSELDAYEKILGTTLKFMDEAFAYQLLAIYDLPPVSLASTITVFKGLRCIDNEDQTIIEDTSKYGIKSFNNKTKFMSYYVQDNYTLTESGRYQLGGVYVTVHPGLAASMLEPLMLEAQFLQGTAQIAWYPIKFGCGK